MQACDAEKDAEVRWRERERENDKRHKVPLTFYFREWSLFHGLFRQTKHSHYYTISSSAIAVRITWRIISLFSKCRPCHLLHCGMGYSAAKRPKVNLQVYHVRSLEGCLANVLDLFDLMLLPGYTLPWLSSSLPLFLVSLVNHWCHPKLAFAIVHWSNHLWTWHVTMIGFVRNEQQ